MTIRVTDDLGTSFNRGLESTKAAIDDAWGQGKDALQETTKSISGASRRARKTLGDGAEHLTDKGLQISDEMISAVSNRPLLSMGIAAVTIWGAWALFKRVAKTP